MPLDLAAIKARCEAASGKAWVFDGDELTIVYGGGSTQTFLAYDKLPLPDAPRPHFRYIADGIFIDHAREDIPALVAEVERLRAVYEPDIDRRPLNAVGVPEESIREAQRMRETEG